MSDIFPIPDCDLAITSPVCLWSTKNFGHVKKGWNSFGFNSDGKKNGITLGLCSSLRELGYTHYMYYEWPHGQYPTKLKTPSDEIDRLKMALDTRTQERDLARKTLDDVRALINGQKL